MSADPDRYKTTPIDPALREAWQSALRRTVVLEIEGRAPVQKLRHLLYQTRLAIQHQEPDLYAAIKHLSITKKKVQHQPVELFTLTISPGDESIRLALKKAGFLQDEPDPDLLDPTK